MHNAVQQQDHEDRLLTIAMVVDSIGSQGNGTSNSALQWAQELERQGHTVRLVGIGAPVYAARVHHVPLVSWVAAKQQMQFAQPSDALFRSAFSGADVVHIHAIGPALLVPYAKMLGMKVVFTHHGPDYDRDKWGFAAKSVLKLGERLGCRFADDVIVISEVIQDLIARKYHRRERVHLIYNGVPKPEICDYPEYFEELGIEKGKYILGMCRFVPEKNLHHLIEAFKKLEAGDCKLVLAGDTDFEDEYSLGLKKMAQEAGVVLTGFVKGHKLHSLLTNARCYCLPSSHEGLPIALLEAMSYHLPVVVSNIPANLEVGLSSDCYFHCGDVDALAARLQKGIDEDYHSVQYDMAPYDWDKIAKQVMGVYEGLLK